MPGINKLHLLEGAVAPKLLGILLKEGVHALSLLNRWKGVGATSGLGEMA